jgi:hypothetical protein
MTRKTWYGEKEETLRKLWEAGVPRPEIAARMGMTLNAVSGAATRLGLTKRSTGGVSGTIRIDVTSERSRQRYLARRAPHRFPGNGPSKEDLRRQLEEAVRNTAKMQSEES